MMTVRQIERSWSSQQYQRLFSDLTAARPESQLRLAIDPGRPVAAAMAIIRMDELDQSHVPLYAQLIRYVLTAQESDGGWGEPIVTALCLRALLCGRGGGVAVERGLEFLANLQKPDGIWPKVPIRRMIEDACTSAFILYQLGDNEMFRARVRLDDALSWFQEHESSLDDQTRQLWNCAALRCLPSRRARELVWS
jgi:hypothetical protein